jgi:DNA-binding NarL/FixJ family response regulator
MSNTLDTDTLTQERKQVLGLYQAGLSVREIAKTLDLSTQRIYQQLKALGLTSPNGKGRP